MWLRSLKLLTLGEASYSLIGDADMSVGTANLTSSYLHLFESSPKDWLLGVLRISRAELGPVILSWFAVL